MWICQGPGSSSYRCTHPFFYPPSVPLTHFVLFLSFLHRSSQSKRFLFRHFVSIRLTSRSMVLCRGGVRPLRMLLTGCKPLQARQKHVHMCKHTHTHTCWGSWYSGAPPQPLRLSTIDEPEKEERMTPSPSSISHTKN